MEEEIISGSDIDKITMIRIVKGIMIDFFRGYPAWGYHGIIEGRFKENLGNIVRDKLENDLLIEVDRTRILIRYRLAPKGIDFAISMINLDYGEKVLKYSKETHKFNRRIILLTTVLFIIGIGTLLAQIFL